VFIEDATSRLMHLQFVEAAAVERKRRGSLLEMIKTCQEAPSRRRNAAVRRRSGGIRPDICLFSAG
jgi:hypothetical protein